MQRGVEMSPFGGRSSPVVHPSGVDRHSVREFHLPVIGPRVPGYNAWAAVLVEGDFTIGPLSPPVIHTKVP